MITITDATGRTGKAVTETLRAKGEKVRVVGRDAKKLASLIELGAESFIGNVEDVASMTEAFVPQEERSPRNTTSTTLESFVTGAFAPAYLQKL